MKEQLISEFGVSSREADVTQLVAKGLTNKEVANQLCVCEKTVKFHLTNIYRKMKIRSRAQLIVACIPYGASQAPEAPQPVDEAPVPLPAGETQSAA